MKFSEYLKNLILIRCTYKNVIARRGKAPTWQSPGTICRSAVQKQTSYREIPTVATLPRNDKNEKTSRFREAFENQSSKNSTFTSTSPMTPGMVPVQVYCHISTL